MNKRIPTFDDFLLENKKGEYSFKEMRKFLQEIIKYMKPEEPGFSGPNIGIPHGRNGTKVIYKYNKEAIPIFDKFNKAYGDEDPTYYVWKYDFIDCPDCKKIKEHSYQRVDLDSLLKFAKANPGKLNRFSISWTSERQKQFGKEMSAGLHGSLD